MSTAALYLVHIVDRKSGEIVETMTSTDARGADKLERGVNINLDHARYYTNVVGPA